MYLHLVLVCATLQRTRLILRSITLIFAYVLLILLLFLKPADRNGRNGL